MKKSRSNWKTFDFGETKSECKPPLKNLPFEAKEDFAISRRHKSTFKSLSKSSKAFDFNEKLAPKVPTDLAVHPKKLKEVELWLQINVLGKNKRQARYLLLNGPTGCGKLITLSVLCKSLEIPVIEWINPLDVDYDEFSRGSFSNQVTKFREFLSESRFPSLNIGSSKSEQVLSNKKLVIVKDFPNAIIRNPQEFFSLLEEISFRNICVAFLCTDSNANSSDSISQKLFPQDIRDKFNIANITFNPCAATLLKQALKRAETILAEYPDLFKKPSPTSINAIATTSGGDLRSAINQLHFSTLIGGTDLAVETKSKTVKRKRGGSTVSVAKSESKLSAMIKDESLGLFHGLGRVLNPKRTENDDWRFTCDVDKLVCEFDTRPMIFVNFLFENYRNYFGDLNDMCEAAEALSLSQNFFVGWNERHDNLIIGLWIAVMGLMIANRHRVTKWNQIRGLRKINKKSQENPLEMKNLSAADLYYYKIITKGRKNSSQSQLSDEEDNMIIED